MKTIVIIGAGKGLGLSLAKKFGKNNFRVVLLSINETTLDYLSKELSDLDVENKAYVVDVRDLDLLGETLLKIEKEFSGIDVVEFSPYAGPEYFKEVTSMTIDDVMQQLEVHLLPAIKIVQTVLPKFKLKGEGAFLFNSGISSIYPIPQLGNAGIACSGLRNYAQNLHNVLKEQNIFVGFISISTLIQKGTEGDPDLIAEQWFNLYDSQNQFELIFPAILQD